MINVACNTPIACFYFSLFSDDESFSEEPFDCSQSLFSSPSPSPDVIILSDDSDKTLTPSDYTCSDSDETLPPTPSDFKDSEGTPDFASKSVSL